MVQSVVVPPEEQLKLVAHHIPVVAPVVADSIRRSQQFERIPKSTFQFEFSIFQRNLPDIADSTVVAVVVDSVAEPVVAAVVVAAAAEELDTVGTDCRLVADRAS